MKKKVLFITTEISPFSKTGGLADISRFLPNRLNKLENFVSVATPYYQDIVFNDHPVLIATKEISILDRTQKAEYYKVIKDGVPIYFIKNNNYFNRGFFYGAFDDAERFIFFSFACLELVKILDKDFDIIHCNDWTSGAIPYLLKHQYPDLKKIKVVFTIHNLEYQGRFPFSCSSLIKESSVPVSFNHFGNFNFMKAGIVEADLITTVSDEYAKEVLTEDYGFTLDGCLNSNKDHLYGVLNGIDYEDFNPETDKGILHNFSINDLSKKELNKKELFNFNKFGTDGPLIVLISRLSTQKGIDILTPIMEDILTYSNASFYLLGSGEKHYEYFFNYLSSKFPKNLRTYIGFSESISRHIYAAADMILLPSLFEPCGIAQMIGMRYGALPICRNIGGLKETVISYDEDKEKVNGFKFNKYNSYDLKEAIYSAIKVYNDDKPLFNKMQKNALTCDYSAVHMAKKYSDLYKKLLGEKK